MKISNLKPLLQDTPETYYWIGLLLADGSISRSGKRLKLHLSNQDADQVWKFADFISYDGNRKGSSVSAMDSQVVPKLGRKFGLVERKSYRPPNLSWIKDDSLFLALFAGFVDGDGNVRKLHKRKDFALRIKCHSSWLIFLQWMSDRLSGMYGIDLPDAKINRAGYAEIHIGNSVILKKIKQQLEQLDLPLLDRKWSQIDLEYVGLKERAALNREAVWKMLDKGMRQVDIATELQLSQSAVCMISKQKER